uniref:PH domain-containing protein n=1 Tax=Oryzias latipes TaxID=8090 RepID=A0A3P9JJQ0_ORYLA
MLKRSKSPVTPGESVFFKPLSVVLKVKSGYLYKSPPQYAIKTEKSWKKRFFVLFKISEGHHQLMYFRSSDDEGQKPLGEIELTRVSLLHRNPQHQPKWEWIQKTFKCSPDHVVYIKTEPRDYFLRGETSEEMDSWFSVLLDALKDRPFRFLSVEEVSNGEHTVEAISGPMVKKKNPPETKKIRSLSVPDVHYNTREEAMDARRPVSYPSKSNRFAHPPLCTVPIVEENKAKNNESSELLYETMEELQLDKDTSTAT